MCHSGPWPSPSPSLNRIFLLEAHDFCPRARACVCALRVTQKEFLITPIPSEVSHPLRAVVGAEVPFFVVSAKVPDPVQGTCCAVPCECHSHSALISLSTKFLCGCAACCRLAVARVSPAHFGAIIALLLRCVSDVLLCWTTATYFAAQERQRPRRRMRIPQPRPSTLRCAHTTFSRSLCSRLLFPFVPLALPAKHFHIDPRHSHRPKTFIVQDRTQ